MVNPLAIVSFSSVSGENPYLRLFYRSLQNLDVQLSEIENIDMNPVDPRLMGIDAIHFHWPEYIWRDRYPQRPWGRFAGKLRSAIPGMWRLLDFADRLFQSPCLGWLQRYRRKQRNIVEFADFVRATQASGVSVVWTVHNMESHEGWDRMDRKGFAVLARAADLIICHSEHAKDACVRQYRPQCPLVVMPHGNYVGVYPEPRPRDVVLRELGLDPSRPVAGCVGLLRGYKGLDLAFDAVGRLGGRVQLLCAGRPHPSYPVEGLQKLATATPGTVLVARGLTDQEFVDFCSACDVMLFPYRRITGSGALLAALSLGRGVVASDLPYFRELLAGHPEAGVLVPRGNVAALARAIDQLLVLDPNRRCAAARGLADRFAWDKVVPPVAEALKAMRASRRDAVIEPS